MEAPTPKKPYYLVTAPESFEVTRFETVSDLMDSLREKRQEELKAPIHSRYLVFQGDRLYLTKGDFKYLVFPDGTKVPLLLAPESVELDDEGWIVDLPDTLKKLEPSPTPEEPETQDPLLDPSMREEYVGEGNYDEYNEFQGM